MRSIVEEALTKARDETVSTSQNNEDLDQILAELKTEITVIGCGGGGSNTISRMMEEGIHGAKLIAINTDAQHLIRTQADQRILVGRQRTRGLGAGSIPQIGEEAALENEQEIRAVVSGSDMVFITVGLGGGTGYRCCPGCCEGCTGRRGTDHCNRYSAFFCGRCHPHGECRGRA